jgi:hypothetical protein
MQPRLLGQQLIVGLNMIGVMGNAIDRTNLDTLRLVIKANTLSAAVGVDHINFITR